MTIKQIAVVAVVVAAVLAVVYFIWGLGYILTAAITAAFCWTFTIKTILGWVATSSAKAVAVMEKPKAPAGPAPDPAASGVTEEVK